MQCVPRETAKARGDKTFYTGEPCSRGHLSERWTASGQCVECKRTLKNGAPRLGNFPWQPTEVERRMVCEMARNGVPRTIIARCLCIAESTLETHCGEALATAQAEANNVVANSLFYMATDGPIQQRLPAAIFWLKVRAGWKEVEYIELLRPPSEMTDDELDQAIRLATGDVRARRKRGRVVNLSAFRKGKAQSA